MSEKASAAAAKIAREIREGAEFFDADAKKGNFDTAQTFADAAEQLRKMGQ